MRRMFGLALLTSCLIAGAAGAGASGRTVERSYEPVYVESGVPAGTTSHSNGVTFRTKASERFVSVTIEDQSGLAIPARIAQDVDGDDVDDLEHEFCGTTSGPVAITPGVPVDVWMSHGTCDGVTDPTSAGGWTTGTVTATFSRT